jgi:uncharacterized protein (TIGR03089 family)
MPGLVGNILAAADPARPLITWYDDATGDRSELSGATLANWVAKTANLLVDGCGLGPGDRAAVLLPPHWQTAAVLLGCWSAGVVVIPAGTAPGPVDVLFAASELLAQAEQWRAGDRFALALAPLAAPLRTVPPGFADYVVEVRGYGDHFEGGGPEGLGGGTITSDSQTGPDELAARSRARATELGIHGGDRVLVDAGVHGDPADWLLGPLLAGASIVLCKHLDVDRLADRVAAEKVTRVL